jgi:hypothetical protein
MRRFYWNFMGGVCTGSLLHGFASLDAEWSTYFVMSGIALTYYMMGRQHNAK